MLETILKELEDSVGTDDFEAVMEDSIIKLEMQNVGIEAVKPLLQLMERHPLDDFGMPGAIVHFVEKYYKNGYEELLLESIKRRPTMHTVWMLNRILNGSNDSEFYLEVMRDITGRMDIEMEIREFAGNLVDK